MRCLKTQLEINISGKKKNFSFKTNFINLLAFLRELEFQENLILLDDINLKLAASKNDNSQSLLEVKLRITFYGKI